MSNKYKIDRRTPEKFSTIREMFSNAVVSDPEHIAFMWQENGDIVKKSNYEFYRDTEALGAACDSLGFDNNHIACIGDNSYKWICTFLMTLMGNCVFVPVDRELSEKDVINILMESDTDFVFCNDKWEKVFAQNREKLSKIKKFISFSREDDSGDFLSYNNLISMGDKIKKSSYEEKHTPEGELKYLVYTSGTTGNAKGVMLTEKNIVSGIYYGMQVSNIFDVGMSVLPLNHTYEAVCDILVSIHSHSTICINDTVRHLLKNMQLYKPEYIQLVPAFTEYFYKNIISKIEKSGKKNAFIRQIKLSNKLRKAGLDLRRLFFGGILDAFGGNLKKIVCGGAPIRPEIAEFFDGIGISLTGGYGITECSPLISVNDDKTNNFNSAGHKLACLEWRIENKDDDGIGEIAVKGDVVMKGYYKRPDLTKEAFTDDGFFLTGDYGYLTENDEIVITGRKKNIIVLQNGKNVFPEEIEAKISSLDFIDEVVVSSIKDENGQEISLAAEIYLSENYKDITEKEVKEGIKNTLMAEPMYKRVSVIKIRTVPFEKTTSNKIKRS